VAWLRLKLVLRYKWRRGSIGERVPLLEEPDHRAELPPVDTGGGYRAPFGSQFSDPSEGHSSPHSEGSNCTMAAAGMALDYQTAGAKRKRGGDMRHKQGDNDGGTDLYDAADAWASYGEELHIKSGDGWGKVIDHLEAGRGVILQGTGGVAGCGDYAGGHAIYVAPERSGSKWLKGDPECSGYEWTEASSLKAFAERLSASVYFAVPPPQPPPPPAPPPFDVGPEQRRAEERGGTMALDAEVSSWLEWISARGRDAWDVAEWGCSRWARQPGAIEPLVSARLARETASAWGAGAWRAVTWG
jgi:hypothetical protein